MEYEATKVIVDTAIKASSLSPLAQITFRLMDFSPDPQASTELPLLIHVDELRRLYARVAGLLDRLDQDRSPDETPNPRSRN